MSKFTFSPWTLMAGMPTNVIAHSGIRVARCDFDGDSSNPECIANARLTAAAPELYEALSRAAVLLKATADFIDANPVKEYMVRFDDADCDGFCLGSDCEIALELASAALAKAEAPNE